MKKICGKWTKKCLDKNINLRLVALFSFLALVFVLLPLVRIAFYATPWYDDYNYGAFAKSFWDQEASLGSLLRGAVHNVRTQWYAWQGTYASVFLMTLVPSVMGEDKYFIAPLFLIFLLVFSVFVLVRVLIINVFKGDRLSCVIMQAVMGILTVLLIHRSQLAFYWYNAGVHYVGMHALLMLWLAACIFLVTAEKLWQKVLFVPLSMLGAAVAGGANFVTALQGGVFLVCIALMILFAGVSKKKVFLLFPAFIVYSVGFLINVMAPGNQVRAAYYVGWGFGPVQSVLRSFVEGVKHIWPFTGWMTVLIMVILVPTIWRLVGRSPVVFRYPALLLVLSFMIYATGFTPSLHSLGHAGLSRTMNAVRLTYQFLLIINEIYCLGWLKQRMERKGKEIHFDKVGLWFYVVTVAAMLVVFALEPDKIGTYSTWGAYENVHSGQAYNYYSQYLDRVEDLRGEEAVVEVEPYHYTPWVICAGDLSENPEAEQNVAIAKWYGKEAVICKKTE